MKTTLEAVRSLVPGKPVPVVERDDQGALVGAWIGYWNFGRGTVSLYPDVRNRFVNWPGGTIPGKRIVSDRLVTVKNEAIAQQKRPLTVKSQTGSAMREISQLEIKFK